MSICETRKNWKYEVAALDFFYYSFKREVSSRSLNITFLQDQNNATI